MDTRQMVTDLMRKDVERLEAKVTKLRRRPSTAFDNNEVALGRAERELDAARRALAARA